MPFGLSIEQLTPIGLLLVGVLMIMTGLLVPYRFYKAKCDESERWRLSFETEREARKLSDAQTTQLLEGQKTSHGMILAIFKNSETLLGGRRDVESERIRTPPEG